MIASINNERNHFANFIPFPNLLVKVRSEEKEQFVPTKTHFTLRFSVSLFSVLGSYTRSFNSRVFSFLFGFFSY